MARTSATAETIRRLPVRCVHRVAGHYFPRWNPLVQYVAMDEVFWFWGQTFSHCSTKLATLRLCGGLQVFASLSFVVSLSTELCPRFDAKLFGLCLQSCHLCSQFFSLVLNSKDGIIQLAARSQQPVVVSLKGMQEYIREISPTSRYDVLEEFF
jgi:hypothetical protein